MSATTPTKRKIHFQVASGLHLEHDGSYSDFDIEKLPGVDWLLLPGDTGSAIRQCDQASPSIPHSEAYFSFLVRMCQKFKRVIMILGNDDFKGPLDAKIHSSSTDSMKAGLDVVKKWMDHPAMNKRLVILNGGERGIPGRHDFMADGYNVTILGCTLWSKLRDD
jgi:hypothetical protein